MEKVKESKRRSPKSSSAKGRMKLETNLSTSDSEMSQPSRKVVETYSDLRVVWKPHDLNGVVEAHNIQRWL